MKKGQFLQIIVSIILIMYSYNYHYGYFDYIQTHDIHMNTQVYYVNMMILFLAHIGFYYGVKHSKPVHTMDYVFITCLILSFILFGYIMYREVKHHQALESKEKRIKKKKEKEEEEEDEEDEEDEENIVKKKTSKETPENLTSIMDIPVLLLFLVWIGIGFSATTDTQARITMTLASTVMMMMMYLMIPYYRKRKTADHTGYVFILAAWILATYHLSRDDVKETTE